MLKYIFAVSAAILIVLFAIANTHVVTLSWIFGPPVQARLITLLVIAFIMGTVFAAIVGSVRKNNVKREIRRASMRPDRLEELDLS